LQAEWDKASSEYAKLEVSVTGMRAELTLLGNQRAITAGQLATLRQPVANNGNVDANLLLQYNRTVLNLQTNIATFDTRIVRDQLVLQQALQRGIILEAQLTRTASDGERLGQQFQLQKRDILKQEKRIKVPVDIKKLPANNQREQAFTTYDDFNYALEKQRLLTSMSVNSRASK
jgi:hypothetical protein